MEFKHTTMATPSPNNSTAPSSHNNSSNAGSGANNHHQSQSQHITTMSSTQGKWRSRPNVRVEPGAHIMLQWRLTLAGVSRGRLRLLPGLKIIPKDRTLISIKGNTFIDYQLAECISWTWDNMFLPFETFLLSSLPFWHFASPQGSVLRRGMPSPNSVQKIVRFTFKLLLLR